MIDFSIQEALDENLKKENEEREPKEIVSWHSSGLGSCRTGQYLKRLGEEPVKDFDARTLRVFAVGNMMEDWLVSKVPNISLETQVRIEDKENNLSGYADVVVEREEGKIVYEVKTIHSRAFWYLQKGEGAYKHHKMQLWTYLNNLGIDEGRIIYLSKDDLAIAEYVVMRDDKEVEKLVMDELNILNGAWKAQLPPEPVRDSKDFRYKYCNFHKKCLKQKKYYKDPNAKECTQSQSSTPNKKKVEKTEKQ